MFLFQIAEAFGGGGGGSGASSSPQSCQVQSPGCYKTGDVKTDFGSLAPAEFSYFLPEEKCKRAENCDCKNVPDNIVQQTNPDVSSGACNCIARSDWNEQGKCCGDDADDCAKIVSGALCNAGTSEQQSNWISPSTNVGDIRYLGCSGAEYLSDGNTWIKCDGTVWKNTINSHEYICIGRGRESIVECCGEGSCNSRIDGKKLTTGQSIQQPPFNTVVSVPSVVLTTTPPTAGGITPPSTSTQEYTRTTGIVSGSGIINCDSGDSRVRCTDEGYGRNHGCDNEGADSCRAWEGGGNNGNANCKITCQRIILSPTSLPPPPIPPTTPPSVSLPGANFISYCRSDGKFVTELDTSEPNRGDASLNNKNKKTCEAAGFKWTGTKCCSEADDNLTSQKEYYNDPGGTGGCWNSNLTISVDFVKSTDNSVINYNGEFHGCAIDRRNFNTNNDNLLALRDKHTNNQLITNHVYCFNDPESNYYCSYSEKWLPTEGTERIRLSTAPASSGTSTSGTVITKVDPPLLGSATYTPSNKNPLEPFIRMNNLFRGSAADPVIVQQGQTVKLEVGVNKVISPSYPIRVYVTKKRGSENIWDRSVYGDGIGFIRDGQKFEVTVQPGQTSAWPTGLYSLYVIIGESLPQLSSSEELFFEVRPGSASSTQTTTSSPLATPLPSECCPQDQCWNGASCISNQRNEPQAQPLNGQRCIDGNWVRSILKFTPDRSKSGYCPRETQCLVDPLAAESAQCIEQNQYIEDNYCENGQWSSRTKLLALKLLKLKGGDFTLFCDTKENTLNNLQYISESGEIVANVLTNLQTNNFCVLKSGSIIIAATSINRNLEDVPANSFNILGVTNCNNALIDDGQYHSCDATNKAWFNKRLKSFIYSATPITIPEEENPLASIDEFITNPIKAVIDAIKRLVTTPPFDGSYVNAIRKFDRLYMTQQGSRIIRGALEGESFKNSVIEYLGFTTNICNFADTFNQARRDASSGISCRMDNSNYYILVQGSKLTSLNPEIIWPDLTSKLRLT
ncbi:MAG: hypothetical protein AABX33_07980 [Nanoarchaeota archaeon]